jgi:hypothetical protein
MAADRSHRLGRHLALGTLAFAACSGLYLFIERVDRASRHPPST